MFNAFEMHLYALQREILIKIYHNQSELLLFFQLLFQSSLDVFEYNFEIVILIY